MKLAITIKLVVRYVFKIIQRYLDRRSSNTSKTCRKWHLKCFVIIALFVTMIHICFYILGCVAFTWSVVDLSVAILLKKTYPPFPITNRSLAERATFCLLPISPGILSGLTLDKFYIPCCNFYDFIHITSILCTKDTAVL